MASAAAAMAVAAAAARRRNCCSVLAAAAALRRGIATSALRPLPMLYSKKHEWVRVDEGDAGVGTVGISNYAQESLGDVVYAQLPEPEESVAAGEDCGALESVKAATEIYSPVSGTVTEKNEAVEETPSLINSSAEDKGWLFRVKMTKEAEELKGLMDAEGYKVYLKSQEEDI